MTLQTRLFTGAASSGVGRTTTTKLCHPLAVSRSKQTVPRQEIKKKEKGIFPHMNAAIYRIFGHVESGFFCFSLCTHCSCLSVCLCRDLGGTVGLMSQLLQDPSRNAFFSDSCRSSRIELKVVAVIAPGCVMKK